MAETKPDRELNEAAFHAKYAYAAGWSDAREFIYQAMEKYRGDERVHGILLQVLEAQSAARDEMRAEYLKAFEL